MYIITCERTRSISKALYIEAIKRAHFRNAFQAQNYTVVPFNGLHSTQIRPKTPIEGLLDARHPNECAIVIPAFQTHFLRSFYPFKTVKVHFKKYVFHISKSDF